VSAMTIVPSAPRRVHPVRQCPNPPGRGHQRVLHPAFHKRENVRAVQTASRRRGHGHPEAGFGGSAPGPGAIRDSIEGRRRRWCAGHRIGRWSSTSYGADPTATGHVTAYRRVSRRPARRRSTSHSGEIRSNRAIVRSVRTARSASTRPAALSSSSYVNGYVHRRLRDSNRLRTTSPPHRRACWIPVRPRAGLVLLAGVTDILALTVDGQPTGQKAGPIATMKDIATRPRRPGWRSAASRRRESAVITVYPSVLTPHRPTCTASPGASCSTRTGRPRPERQRPASTTAWASTSSSMPPATSPFAEEPHRRRSVGLGTAGYGSGLPRGGHHLGLCTAVSGDGIGYALKADGAEVGWTRRPSRTGCCTHPTSWRRSATSTASSSSRARARFTAAGRRHRPGLGRRCLRRIR